MPLPRCPGKRNNRNTGVLQRICGWRMPVFFTAKKKKLRGRDEAPAGKGFLRAVKAGGDVQGPGAQAPGRAGGRPGSGPGQSATETLKPGRRREQIGGEEKGPEREMNSDIFLTKTVDCFGNAQCSTKTISQVKVSHGTNLIFVV